MLYYLFSINISMLISDLKSKTYKGVPLEEGGTSISTSTAPAIRQLFMDKDISDDTKVLDYGAGKTGRNASWLRSRGVKVYGYDLHNGSGKDGWTGVSGSLPDDKFDIAFSCYVLNVVPENVEDEIIEKMSRYAPKCYHVTRNKDIFKMVKSALERGDKVVTKFFEDEFGGGALSEGNIMDFCLHGTQTSKGFQRIPMLEHKGFTLVKSTDGYKVYQN